MKAARVLYPIVALCASTAALAAGADPTTGAKLAKSECAACHAIGPDFEARSPEPKAPRFADVAKMPSTTELSIKVFLRSTHKTMPNIILSDEELDSVAAYILGLRGK